MPTLRAVLVTVPPLLADLVRHVTTGPPGLSIVAEISDLKTADQRLRELAPDVVILGAAATAGTLNAAASDRCCAREGGGAIDDFAQLFASNEDRTSMSSRRRRWSILCGGNRGPGYRSRSLYPLYPRMDCAPAPQLDKVKRQSSHRSAL